MRHVLRSVRRTDLLDDPRNGGRHARCDPGISQQRSSLVILRRRRRHDFDFFREDRPGNEFNGLIPARELTACPCQVVRPVQKRAHGAAGWLGQSIGAPGHQSSRAKHSRSGQPG